MCVTKQCSAAQRALERSRSVLNGIKHFPLFKRICAATWSSAGLLPDGFCDLKCLLLNSSLIVVGKLVLVTPVQQHLAVSFASLSTSLEFCC